MDTEKFQSQLKTILPLVLTHGSDFYGLTKENFTEKLKELPGRAFMNKCHDGFKQAQKIIASNMLELDEEIKLAKKELKKLVSLNPQHPQRTPGHKADRKSVV